MEDIKMPKSYIDPDKQLSRVMLLNFIRKYWQKLSNYADEMRVICLPGAENEGEEALEVIEIYDQLKIPRQAIFGFEKDAKRCQRLVNANLGINVFNMDVLDFLRNYQGEQFNIVSLDLTCKKNPDINRIIFQLVGKQLLSKFSVLMINTYGTRENMEQNYLKFQAGYNRGLGPQIMTQLTSTKDGNFELLSEHFSKINPHQFELGEARDLFTKDIIRSLALGRYALDQEFDDLIKAYPYAKTYGQECEARLIAKGAPKAAFGLIVEAFHKEKMLDHLQKLFNRLDYQQCFWILEYLSPLFAGTYFVRQIERFKYVSNSHAPMEMDIFLTENCLDYYKRIAPMFHFAPGYDDGKILRLSPKFNSKRVNKVLMQMGREASANQIVTFRHPLPERILLKHSED
jgi:hypothetical protein